MCGGTLGMKISFLIQAAFFGILELGRFCRVRLFKFATYKLDRKT